MTKQECLQRAEESRQRAIDNRNVWTKQQVQEAIDQFRRHMDAAHIRKQTERRAFLSA